MGLVLVLCCRDRNTTGSGGDCRIERGIPGGALPADLLFTGHTPVNGFGDSRAFLSPTRVLAVHSDRPRWRSPARHLSGFGSSGSNRLATPMFDTLLALPRGAAPTRCPTTAIVEGIWLASEARRWAGGRRAGSGRAGLWLATATLMAAGLALEKLQADGNSALGKLRRDISPLTLGAAGRSPTAISSTTSR